MIWGSSFFAFTADGTDTGFMRIGEMEHMEIQEIAWAESRGLDVELATKNGLTCEGSKIGFRYVSGGQERFTKWRNQDKSGWMIKPAGQRMSFFNVDCLSEKLSDKDFETPLIITEGEIDALSCMEAGFRYVLSVPNGANDKPTEGDIDAEYDPQFQYFWDAYSQIEKFGKVILFTDTDNPGLVLRDELKIRIGDIKCWYVKPPFDCKDANDVLKKHGVEALKKVINEARPLVSDEIYGLFELPDEPELPAIHTGWHEMDKHCVFRRPEFVVITGQPGTGKTQFARSLAFHMALGTSRENFKTGSEAVKGLIFTLEDKAKYLKRDAHDYMSGIGFETNDPAKLDRIEKIVSQRLKIIKTGDDVLSLDWAIKKLEMAVMRRDCKFVILDPWNEIEHEFGRVPETVYIGNAIRKLKRICNRLGVLLIVVAHPVKLDDGKIDLYSIAGSANWYNKCDHGIVLSKHSSLENIMKVWVQKSKDWEEMGAPGEVHMRFSRERKDFDIVPEEQIEILEEAKENAA